GVFSPEAHAFVEECLARHAHESAAKGTNGSITCEHASGTDPSPQQDPVGALHASMPMGKRPAAKVIEPIVTLDEATMKAQAEACAAVLDVELPRLLQVTPRLQLFCQHPKDDLYALSGIFTDVEKATMAAIRANLAGYNGNYLLNECTTDKAVTNELRSGKAIKNLDITQRRRLMLDVDPIKDVGESAATDTQLGYAEEVTVNVLTELHEQHGIPIPDIHYSGNGVQSIWLID